ncbi:MAG: chorismate mutase [Anaerolineae bacterium]|jgi:chorismate mutase|nr:chorismate mutase [Anaerolineae bacterium]MBT7189561.1 chorismate mutase [Anaerolineae bacterium]MBT7992102.1 chorismate mutase [Anaerolineae bacterium]
MSVRGIRGAITIAFDTKEEILSATQELLLAILAENPALAKEDIASVLFTTTRDVAAEFPAVAARTLGWSAVPMLCTQEIPVPGSLPKAIRVLLHWNTNKKQEEIKHIYLRDAKKLRPDIAS